MKPLFKLDLVREPSRDLLKKQTTQILNKLEKRERFSYVKINHGLWERLLATEKLLELGSKSLADLETGDYFHVGGFRKEIVEMLKNGVSSRKDFILAISIHAFPNSSKLTGWPKNVEKVVEYIHNLLPRDLKIWDGLMWKAAALDGRLKEFAEILKQRPVCLVGPPHLLSVKDYFELNNFHHISIPLLTARKNRWELLEEISAWTKNREGDPVVLFQAGSLSAWLISHLDEHLCQATLLDLGRTLDLAEPAIVERQEWGTLLCSQLNQANVGMGRVREPRDWDSQIVDLCKIPGAIFEPDNYVEKHVKKVEFLENKSTYSSIVDYLLQLSARENHWSNYGPVTRLLEQVIGQMIKLPDHLSVIACSSATSGLEGLVSLEEELAGRQLKWIVPAYTFPSSLSVCRGRAQVIDVLEDGQFSLDDLTLVPANSYDAVLVTNLFGRSNSLEQIIKFCESSGKKLVLDNATGLNANIERTADWPGEAISFHHTKVWGMGEGGCVICKKKNETMLRALLSPGLQAPVSPERRRNAKLDDFSSARILGRLIYSPRWQRSYDWQMWRIEQAALEAGFSLFGPDSHAHSIRASSSFTPLLAPQRLDLTASNTSRVTLQKYYRPLASKPIANDLFSRVLAVPNHRGMAQFSNRELKELLQNLFVGGTN